MITIRSLEESLSAIVYHNTYISRLADIIKTDKFELATNLGTMSDQFGTKFYYLSLSRVKYGGYARSMSEDNLVNIVLDGKKFNQRYKGGPVDYWGQEMRSQGSSDQKLRNDENEERVFTDNPTIPKALSYFLSVHISLGDMKGKSEEEIWGAIFDRGDRFELKQIGENLQAKGIPVYYYTDFSAFKTLNTRKALQGFLRGDKSYVGAIVKVYKTCKTLNDIPNEYPFDRIKSDLQNPEWVDNRNETVHQLQNDIHNDRSSTDGRERIAQLTNLMRKEKVRTVIDFLKKLSQRLTSQ